jgi:hypothetical protein
MEMAGFFWPICWRRHIFGTKVASIARSHLPPELSHENDEYLNVVHPPVRTLKGSAAAFDGIARLFHVITAFILQFRGSKADVKCRRDNRLPLNPSLESDRLCLA